MKHELSEQTFSHLRKIITKGFKSKKLNSKTFGLGVIIP